MFTESLLSNRSTCYIMFVNSGKIWESMNSKVTGNGQDDGVYFSVWEQFSCLQLCPDQLWGPSTNLPKATSLEIRWVECEVDHSPLSSTDIKNVWAFISTPHMSSSCALFTVSANTYDYNLCHLLSSFPP
jgi:hypothetical protein